MALETKSLKAINALATPYPASAGAGYRVPRLTSYASPDNLATITAANYFNGAAALLLVGDIILIQHTTGGSTGHAIRTVTANDGTTVTISALG